jgi:phosphoglycolate phosphatase
VDSRRDLAESANTVLVGYGCPPLSEAAIGRMVGDGAAALVHRAFHASGCLQPADALDRFLAIYSDRLLRFTRPYDGIPEVLAALAPRATLAVLTNKPLRATRQILDGLDLARYFDPARVYGGDGPDPRKPDPSGLRRLAHDSGIAPEATTLVGDSPIDLRTARAAGMRVCLASYGFGFEGVATQELGLHDVVVKSPIELLTVL